MKKLKTEEDDLIKEIKLERKIAKILATQYWMGMNSNKIGKFMTKQEYINNSFIGWLLAARGVVLLVKRDLKGNIIE